MFQTVLLFVSGLYLLFVGLAMSTKNYQSMFLFKFVPVILGGGLLLLGLKAVGVV